MSLGNFKSTPVYFNGHVVGHNVYSEDFKVGEHCTGHSYDGETVGRFGLDLDGFMRPEVTVTVIGDEYAISVDGEAKLDDWERLFTDALNHIKALKAGK